MLKQSYNILLLAQIYFSPQSNKSMINEHKRNKQATLNKQTQKNSQKDQKTNKKQSCPYHRQDNKKYIQSTPAKRSQSQQKSRTINKNQHKIAGKLQVISEQRKQRSGSNLIVKQKQQSSTIRKVKHSSATNYELYNNPKASSKSKRVEEKPMKLIPQLIREQQQHAKFAGEHEIEDERLEMLKLYIKQDSERIERLKRIRDEHVINQINCTQNSLKMKAAISSPISNDQFKGYQSQLLQLQKKHQQILKNHCKQITNLKNDLLNQKCLKQKLHKQTIDFEKTINTMRAQLQKKDKPQLGALNNQSMSRASKSIPVQKQVPRENKKYSQEYIKSLQVTINELKSTKELLEQKLKKCQAQKQIIKRNANEVLAVVQKQIVRAQGQKTNCY